MILKLTNNHFIHMTTDYLIGHGQIVEFAAYCDNRGRIMMRNGHLFRISSQEGLQLWMGISSSILLDMTDMGQMKIDGIDLVD